MTLAVMIGQAAEPMKGGQVGGGYSLGGDGQHALLPELILAPILGE